MTTSKVKNLACLAAVAAITIAICIQTAAAVTVTQFESVTEEQQNQWLAAQTLLMEDWYKKNAKKNLAVCMSKLRAISHARAAGDYSQGLGLYDLIRNEIRKASIVNPDAYHVEQIIAGVVEHECAKQ